MKFYTGIPTIKAFNVLYSIILPIIATLRYWRVSCNTFANIIKPKAKIGKKPGPKRNLSTKDEMLLTQMKIRLGLLNTDLADRFGVNQQSVSIIFATWINVLSEYIGTLVGNPSKENVRESLPPSFNNKTYRNVRHIIDCTEFFLERPKNLKIQSQTWSDYKSHNTAKILVSITPSGYINFISEAWGGRASDNFITKNCGFLDLIEPFDKVLADRGFTINEELVLKQANLLIPPGRRGAAQFTEIEVKKTKEIANRRIYVEQAIRRLKCFRILKYEIPLTLLQHIDQIVKVAAGLCNLYPPLPKY